MKRNIEKDIQGLREKMQEKNWKGKQWKRETRKESERIRMG